MCNLGSLVRGQFGKVLVPDPADLVGRVILVLREPELPLFTDDIEDLASRNQHRSRNVGRSTMEGFSYLSSHVG